MRILKKFLDKTSSGSISMIPENEEDMWLLYNLIQVHDLLECSTFRKVQNESATGSVQNKQVRTTLTIEVETNDYDSHAQCIHFKGRNKKENPYVKLNAYHTVSVKINEKFTLMKTEWDTISLMLVEQASDPTQNCDVAAIVMHEGLAHLCLISSSTTHVRAKIEANIPKKRSGFPTTSHDKSVNKFFDQIILAIERNIKFDIVKCIILASPGFTRNTFFDYMMEDAKKNDKKILLDGKSKFMLVHSSSGHMGALNEILKNPLVSAKMADTKAIEQVKLLDEFYSVLSGSPERAFYGMNHVKAAIDSQAVEKLLISDKLFRAKDIKTRKMYVKMVDDVKSSNGTVYVFSSLHTSGIQLNDLSGLVAILRFAIPEPESDDDSCSENED